MSKVLFFGVPAHGHTNPSLGLVAELVRRGERVIYYSFPLFRDKILATGAEYRESPGDWGQVDQAHLVSRLSYLYQAVVEATVVAIEPCIQVIQREQPDYVIHDSLAPWGKFAAQITGTPVVASISTFLFSHRSTTWKSLWSVVSQIRAVDLRVMKEASKSARWLKDHHGITETGFLEILNNTSELNIVYTLRGLQPAGQTFDPTRYRFVGPSLSPRVSDPGEPAYCELKKPLIYLCLGTILHHQAEFYRAILARFLTWEGTLVLSVGTTDIGSLGPIPPQTLVLGRVNQMEVLQNADLFITHGGMNSVHEALYFGVPMVILPFQEEQRTTARRCVALGCGLSPQTRNAPEVFAAAQKILQTPSFRERAEAIGQQLQTSGGALDAVDAIFEYLKSKQPPPGQIKPATGSHPAQA